jgi:hypothetical protein
VTDQPQWMTDELLEQWSRDARLNVNCLGGDYLYYSQGDKILTLISALRAARANQATEAGRGLVAAVMESTGNIFSGDPAFDDSWPTSVVRVRNAYRAVLAERAPKTKEPRYDVWEFPGDPEPDNWCVTDNGHQMPSKYTERQARAVADALNREAERV